jgi:hypothetical protein
MMRLALLAVGLSTLAVAPSRESDWTIFHDPSYRFDYPKGWKITTETSPVMHYRQVQVALNNFGKERFQVLDFNTAAHPDAYGVATTLKQLPAGAIYLDIATWGGPPLPPDFKFADTPAEEIAAQLARAPEPDREDKQLFFSQIEFCKGGRR